MVLTAMSLESDHFDVALLGTGLTQSVLAAALSRSGYSVLHIDPNDYYGSECASLSLTELNEWAKKTKASHAHNTTGQARLSDVELYWPAFNSESVVTDGVPEELCSLDRHYSLSLSPTLIPSVGPAIDAMVQSKVASYCTFRLLERTVLYVPGTSPDSVGALKAVPSSKEDIFKDRSISLIDKRKLMRMLLDAASQADNFSEAERQGNTRRGLRRKDADGICPPSEPFLSYLQRKYSLPPHLAQAIAYGVALCSSDQDATLPSLVTAQDHLRSIGRYGNSAYLVGQYGGAGEMAQGYCRAAAVYGGTYILARKLQRLALRPPDAAVDVSASSTTADDACSPSSSACWQIEVDGIDNRFTAEWVVSSDNMLADLLPNENSNADDNSSDESLETLRGIVVLDRPLHFESAAAQDLKVMGFAGETSSPTVPSNPPETALLIFPPDALSRTGDPPLKHAKYSTTVLMMGEGTFSCPKGQYVYYLTTYACRSDVSSSVKQKLQPALNAVLKLSAPSAPEWASSDPSSSQGSLPIPLLELFFRSRSTSTQHTSSSPSTHHNLLRVPIPPPHPAPHTLTTLPSSSVLCARSLFYTIAGPGSEAAAERQQARRKRERNMGEYAGRGGRGPEDDEVLGRRDDSEDGEDVVEFFGPRKGEEQDEIDD